MASKSNGGGGVGRRSMALFDTTVGVNDACLLEPLDEDHFVENLRSRFHHSIIYVSTQLTDFDLFFTSLTLPCMLTLTLALALMLTRSLCTDLHRQCRGVRESVQATAAVQSRYYRGVQEQDHLRDGATHVSSVCIMNICVGSTVYCIVVRSSGMYVPVFSEILLCGVA